MFLSKEERERLGVKWRKEQSGDRYIGEFFNGIITIVLLVPEKKGGNYKSYMLSHTSYQHEYLTESPDLNIAKIGAEFILATYIAKWGTECSDIISSTRDMLFNFDAKPISKDRAVDLSTKEI